MSFSVSNFTSQLTYDGARPNLFQVVMAFPVAVATSVSASPGLAAFAGQEIQFMAKAASLPSSHVGVVNIPYMGRQVKVPGNVIYDDWTITIINDENFPIRNAFETWHNLINSHGGNLRDNSMITSYGYAINATVLQFGKNGAPVKSYDFIGMWPNMISPIALDWGTNDTIEQFDVTFSLQYWESASSTT